MSINPKIALLPLRVLYVESRDLKGRMGKSKEFLSFNTDLLHDVAQLLIAKEYISISTSPRLVFVPDERGEEKYVWYDVASTPQKYLPELSQLGRNLSGVEGINAVNDELRSGYGFSTHDIPVSPDELHALRICLPGMPKVHSAWIRGELKYLLFENGVLARRC